MCLLSLDQDPVAHSLTLLGSFPDMEDSSLMTPAVVRIEKTALSAANAPFFLGRTLADVQLMESTNIVWTTRVRYGRLLTVCLVVHLDAGMDQYLTRTSRCQDQYRAPSHGRAHSQGEWASHVPVHSTER